MTPPTPDPTFLANNFAVVTGRLLDLVAEYLGDDAPVRRYLSAGIPAWDLDSCGQLVLYPATVQPGYPGASQGGRPDATPNIGRTYVLVVELARCVAGLSDSGGQTILPTVEELQASGARMFRDYRMLDLWLPTVAVNSKIADRQLQIHGLQAVAPLGITGVQPQGNMAAVRLTFSIVV